MKQDMGVSAKADRATHEPSPDGLGHTVSVPDAVPICVLCKHYERVLRQAVFQPGVGLTSVKDNFGRCRHPLVYSVLNGARNLDCETARTAGSCGHAGKLHSPIDSAAALMAELFAQAMSAGTAETEGESPNGVA